MHCKCSMHIPLPPLKKTVLYVDQFFFSHAFRGGEKQFVQAADRIKGISALQLMVVPYSSIHKDETHQWAGRDALYDFIRATSRGHEFEPAYQVERTQVLKGFQAWLANKSPKYILEQRDALNEDVHGWDSYFRIEVGRYMGDIELIRGLKQQSIEGLVELFDDWRESTNTFDEDVKSELAAAGKNYIDSYLKFVVRVGHGDYSALFDSPVVSMVVQQMMYCLPKGMPPDECLRQCAHFFTSEHFAQLPCHAISAKVFATLKTMVKAGAHTNRQKAMLRLSGFFYDVNHIATYAPYCQGFVMDKPMAELMSHPQVALEDNFGVKVFSLNNWDELFTWLDGLEVAMSAEHKAGLEAAYP